MASRSGLLTLKLHLIIPFVVVDVAEVTCIMFPPPIHVKVGLLYFSAVYEFNAKP